MPFCVFISTKFSFLTLYTFFYRTRAKHSKTKVKLYNIKEIIQQITETFEDIIALEEEFIK